MFEHDWAGAEKWNKTGTAQNYVFFETNAVLMQSDQNQQPNASDQEPSLMQKTTYPNAHSTSAKSNSPVVFMRRY